MTLQGGELSCARTVDVCSQGNLKGKCPTEHAFRNAGRLVVKEKPVWVQTTSAKALKHHLGDRWVSRRLRMPAMAFCCS